MENSNAATARKPAAGPSLRRLVWWTIWFCLAAWLLIRLPSEVSYWMLALAEKASIEGRTDEALAWVERAKEWTPESTLPIQRQAQILMRDKNADPLALIDALLAGNPDHRRKTDLYLLKSELYRAQKDYKSALREFDAATDFQGSLRPSMRRLELLLLIGDRNQARRELDQITKQAAEKSGTALSDNDLAYFSALIGDKLEDALIQVERALVGQADEPAFLDTRGFILHRLGRNEEALPDLHAAVEKMEAAGVAQMQNSQARKAMAVIVYHRSLVLEALGKSSEAELDRSRVREMGFEPDERLF